MYARNSTKDQYFAVRINHLEVQTAYENNFITFYEKKIESTIPKLFKEISLLKSNPDLIKLS